MSSYEKQAVIFSKFVDNFADLMKTHIFQLNYLIPAVLSRISSGSLDLHTGGLLTVTATGDLNCIEFHTQLGTLAIT